MNTNPPILQNIRQPEHIALMGGDIFPHFTGADTSGQAFAAFNIFPPGTGVPPHIHDLEDEAFYVQEGELEVLLGAETRRLKAGQSAWLPRNVVHAWSVAGDQPAKFLLVVTPAGLENLFRELAALPADRLDAQTLDEISTRYRIKFL